jgi:triosephosphate isomerase
MRKKPYIVANWKMYRIPEGVVSYIDTLKVGVDARQSHVWLAVPFTVIADSVLAAEGSEIRIGAQNMNSVERGALTGEIAASMLKEAGAFFVLLGHSERRLYFHESDEVIRAKVDRAVAEGLTSILCVGETLSENQVGQRDLILKRQLETALSGAVLSDKKYPFCVAYEPVWAIGTGRSATPQEAQEAHLVCRDILTSLLGKVRGRAIPILYGGSVNGENVKDFLAQKDIDGVLVGGASLDAKTWVRLIQNGVSGLPEGKTTLKKTKRTVTMPPKKRPEK